MPYKYNEKWNAVMRALEKLYECWQTDVEDLEDEALDDALEELMKAYDRWLD